MVTSSHYTRILPHTLLTTTGTVGGASDSEEGSEDSGDEAHKDVTFAPDDAPELSMVKPKADTFGLGYTPLSRASVLGGHVNLFDPAPLSLTEKKKKLLIKGQVWSNVLLGLLAVWLRGSNLGSAKLR